ncbi:PAQR family membrane homeostasis protein TrhA [Moheibacter sediminis]|uniref:Hemolysin III n=1 Tax=Moheibacter sediminis TaxID=1434700 RepID=A0A1W1ZE52_9FLAO|nr:hemolysin III family protein [Moheibacter sediminis]SMC46667.1 hemolysin III [Moheibacter sediminis]
MPFKSIDYRQEEFWNVFTHGVGALLSFFGLFVLIYFASQSGSKIELICASVFGLSMVILYLASTIYHAVSNEKRKLIFQKLDHLCIYILIAGTYTPIALLGLKGAWGWSIFGSIWGMAALGFVFKFSPLRKSEKLSLILYAAMGWLIIIAIKPLVENLSSETLWLMGLGGLFYTVGIYFYVKEKIPYNHAIWHFFVLAGSTFHYFGILLYFI